ncbi:hypothetical protein [Photobacterium kishitanii]|nr:hypothetical protein [Photobacterium kishitanii]
MVAFEMLPRLIGQHGGGNAEYAILNEQHATLLIINDSISLLAKT